MYPVDMPAMPAEIVEIFNANPEAIAEAMGNGMEAMTAAIGDGASIADAYEAMGDMMADAMGELGITPEIFEVVGDALGAMVGPALHMSPADATGPDMGAVMQDGVAMMLPEGTSLSPVVNDAIGDMGSAMADAGMGAHDIGAEMMGPPGSDTYLLPLDGQGDPLVEAGQPETCPGSAVQGPPMDGNCAANGNMPPVDGYDHMDPPADTQMAETYDMETATNVSQGLNPDGTDPLTNVQSEADSSEVNGIDTPGYSDLAGSLGGGDTAQPTDEALAADAADAAVNTAIDGAQAQGGGGNNPNAQPEPLGVDDPGYGETADSSDSSSTDNSGGG